MQTGTVSKIKFNDQVLVDLSNNQTIIVIENDDVNVDLNVSTLNGNLTLIRDSDYRLSLTGIITA